MEHAELVAEMAHVERLSTQERLHLARRRRLQQLKVWSHREKEWMRLQKQQRANNVHRRNGHRRVYFSNSVMLLEAASRNDIDEVRKLLMSGVDPDSTNEDGLTALHQCCIDDNEEMMKLLIEFGANPNAEDSEKWTPLHAAATCAHLHLVRYLISKGANLLAVNADGNMPYDICEDEAALDYIESEMARRGVTQELIDETRAATETTMLRDLQELTSAGVDLETADEQGATPLHIAAANGYLRVVEFLLDNNVSTDVRDCDDWQPVHAAACWGHMDVLELLVQHGADLTARTKHDETPADICEDPELRERITLLRTEQEQTRKEKEQKRKVRRSQSNTRTQSVRRTSIRERSLAQKKDAQEEGARLRLTVAQDQPPDVNGVGDLESPSIDIVESKPAEIPPSTPNWQRKEPEGKDKPEQLTQQYENNNPPLVLPTADAAYDTTNGKININVTVTINTLADLKKQRAQIRSSGRSPRTSLAGSEAHSAPHSNSAELASAHVQKFTGPTTGDVVGDVRSRRCCVIM